jgi:restriction endonuclease
MKLKFKTQDFQTAAVTTVVDLFKGQERRRDTFTIANEAQGSLDNLGYKQFPKAYETIVKCSKIYL